MSRLEYLYEKCMAAEAGAGEQQEFLQLLRAEENALVAKQLIARAYHAPKEVVDIDEESSRAILEAIFKAAGTNNPPVQRVPSLTGGRHFLKTAWPAWRQAGFKYAAAILLIITVVGLYYGLFHTSQPGTKVVHTAPPTVPAPDVLPGSDKAILTLSDGSKVQLNNATSETISDGTLSIKNANGQLVYSNPSSGSISPAGGGGRSLPAGRQGGSRGEAARTATNIMSTPKGGQYKLTLADGTTVWLNAASSITYPVAFAGQTREVSVTGEAYFEVTKNKEKPFIVTVAGLSPAGGSGAAGAEGGFLPAGRQGAEARTAGYTITVLGTTFNVNSYPDEPFIKTSLIEGSVKVQEKILTPGQAYTNGAVTTTNLSKDLAWRNGEFNFEKSTLREAMRQLARWYDIEVEYMPNVPDIKFYGSIKRSVPLSTVLKALQKAGVNFTITDNKKLIVKP